MTGKFVEEVTNYRCVGCGWTNPAKEKVIAHTDECLRLEGSTSAYNTKRNNNQ